MSISNKIAMEGVTNKYIQCVRCLLNTKLSARNVNKAINIFATPVLTYCFSVLNWTKTNLYNIDVKTRVEVSRSSTHYLHSTTKNFCFPRRQGGRGISKAYFRHFVEVKNLSDYFLEKVKASGLRRVINSHKVI